MDCEHAEVPWCLRCKAFIKVDLAFNSLCSEAFFFFVIIIKGEQRYSEWSSKSNTATVPGKHPAGIMIKKI